MPSKPPILITWDTCCILGLFNKEPDKLAGLTYELRECDEGRAFLLSVHDGESITLRKSVDRTAIIAALGTTDEDMLFVYKKGSVQRFGVVVFIYGNDGWDTLNDNSTSLEEYLKPVQELADKLSDQA